MAWPVVWRPIVMLDKTEIQPGEGATAATIEALASPTASRVAKATDVQLIPARMLNEFVYCPRLFYYEFVEGVFVESADTLRGGVIHQRVDSGNGALPAARRRRKQQNGQGGGAGDRDSTARPEERRSAEPETIHSRSVQMGSERLGVVAKMDLVEARGQPTPDGQEDLLTVLEVCPVDYKAGSPRPGTDAAGGAGLNELWDTDKMQLGLQALILRDNGYTCREGVIYYRGTRQRVRLPVTPELETWILDRIAEARRACAGPMPPPLARSPKCARCSLAPVCLPDETCMLAQPTTPESPAEPPVATTPPRRLMAPRDDNRALYLNTPGYRVGRKDEVLTVKDEDTVIEEVRLNDVSHVALFGNIQLTTQAIQALCDVEVPVTYFSGGGWFYGMTHGHGLKNVFLRIEQFRLARDPAFVLRIARALVNGKIRNHRTLLMRNHVEAPAGTVNRLREAAQDALAADGLDQLLGIEGAAAAAYFEQFSGMLKTRIRTTTISRARDAPPTEAAA